MQVFDASSMIYAWDNYPIRNFPGLWDWMAEQVEEAKLMMPSVALDEVANKTPECGEWLEENNLEQLEINNAILHDAMRIKRLLGIVADKYHSKGVGENDILIIATARAHSAVLVSDEVRQPTSPVEPSKRKIPAVCGMMEVNVPCINFIEFIKRSDEIFH
jgi:predicted nucleic acid-binding protein